MLIRYRSQVVDDIEVIEYEINNEVKEFQRDAWEGLSTAEAIIHHEFPRESHEWEITNMPYSDDWEAMIHYYND